MPDTTRFAFTKKRLESLSPPPDKRVYVYDAKCEGLALCLTPAGGKTFYLYKWSAGRPVRIPLGKFPAVSVENARKSAKALVNEIAQGRDPATARQEKRREMTLKELFTHWLENHAKPRNKGWPEDEKRFDRYLAPWQNRKISAIKRSEAQALFVSIATDPDRGKYAANRLLALLRALYNQAADLGLEVANPTDGIKKYPEEKRDRFLHGEDLRVFFASLAEEPNADLRDFFTTCLFVGARKSNVLSMKWEEIDFRAGIWRIPDTKSGQPVVVPLVGPVLQLLAARRNASNGSEWVFPSHGKTGHLVEPKSAWKRIIGRAELKDVRPHDLRRSLGSWMAITGAGLPIVGKMLGHSQPSTTAIYARLSVDPVRMAAEAATAAMIEAGKPIVEVASEGGEGDE